LGVSSGLHTPPLPATHAEVGTGTRALARNHVTGINRPSPTHPLATRTLVSHACRPIIPDPSRAGPTHPHRSPPTPRHRSGRQDPHQIDDAPDLTWGNGTRQHGADGGKATSNPPVVWQSAARADLARWGRSGAASALRSWGTTLIYAVRSSKAVFPGQRVDSSVRTGHLECPFKGLPEGSNPPPPPPIRAAELQFRDAGPRRGRPGAARAWSCSSSPGAIGRLDRHPSGAVAARPPQPGPSPPGRPGRPGVTWPTPCPAYNAMASTWPVTARLGVATNHRGIGSDPLAV